MYICFQDLHRSNFAEQPAISRPSLFHATATWESATDPTQKRTSRSSHVRPDTPIAGGGGDAPHQHRRDRTHRSIEKSDETFPALGDGEQN